MSDISDPEYDDPALEELLDENARLRESKAELLAALKELMGQLDDPSTMRATKSKALIAIANAENVT